MVVSTDLEYKDCASFLTLWVSLEVRLDSHYKYRPELTKDIEIESCDVLELLID